MLLKFDELAKSRKAPFFVIPAPVLRSGPATEDGEAGIQENKGIPGPGLRRGNGFEDFLRSRQVWITELSRQPTNLQDRGSATRFFRRLIILKI